MNDIKYPHVRVKLTGTDGNAFALLGKVKGAMKKGGCTPDEVKQFMDEAMSGDYNHLLATCMSYVSVS